jgi:hypothetical protein
MDGSATIKRPINRVCFAFVFVFLTGAPLRTIIPSLVFKRRADDYRLASESILSTTSTDASAARYIGRKTHIILRQNAA